MGTLYLLYFLRDAVHYKHPAEGLLILIVIYTGVRGRHGDRRRGDFRPVGKRKLIVTVSGWLMGAAALLLTFVETWPAAMVAAVLFGCGLRRYLAVDQALITQVLPQPGTGPRIWASSTSRSSARPRSARRSRPPWSPRRLPALSAPRPWWRSLASAFVWKIKSVP